MEGLLQSPSACYSSVLSLGVAGEESRIHLRRTPARSRGASPGPPTPRPTPSPLTGSRSAPVRTPVATSPSRRAAGSHTIGFVGPGGCKARTGQCKSWAGQHEHRRRGVPSLAPDRGIVTRYWRTAASRRSPMSRWSDRGGHLERGRPGTDDNARADRRTGEADQIVISESRTRTARTS